MSKVYDNFAREFIDEEDMEAIAPPERYTIMEDDLEPTKIDYVTRKVTKQVYNVFPFVGIKCEPNRSWNNNDYDIIARWYHNGDEHVFKYTITDDFLGYVANDLDYIVLSLTHQICEKIMESCNEDKETEDK